MNRELTREEIEDQKRLLRILERSRVSEWLGGAEFYEQVIRNLDAMQTTGTTDGDDLAELTDDDAKERPWVMVRDSESYPWQGPARLLAVAEGHSARFVAKCNGYYTWKQCRRATKNELKQAGITQ